MATEKELKARRICAKLQLKAYRRKWTPKQSGLWDKMINIILKERER